MINPINIEKALLYEKYRLPYAAEAMEDLLGLIGGMQIVTDIGAGTGQLAKLLAQRCARIYAIEPDPAMRQVASLSLASFANIQILAGFAEQIPLAGNSIDLVVVGNAFHRFKPEACQELYRILKNTGWVALFGYKFVNKNLSEMLFTKPAALKSTVSKTELSWHKTPIQNLFGNGQIHTLSYSQSHKEDWTAFFGAACAGLEAPDQKDSDYGLFETFNHQVFDAFAVNGKIQIDYETQVTFGQPLFV